MADPRPGNDLTKKMNPRMGDGHIDFSLARMRDVRALQSGDGATRGIGTMKRTAGAARATSWSEPAC